MGRPTLGHCNTLMSCLVIAEVHVEGVYPVGLDKQPEILRKPDNKTANIYVKKAVVLNTLVPMMLVSDVENSKN